MLKARDFNDDEFDNIIKNVQVSDNKVVFITKEDLRFEYRNLYLTNNSNTMYGYRKVNGKLIVNQYEKEVINYIFDCFIDGDKLSEIQVKLQEKNYKTRSGKTLWGNGMIRFYLRNESYIGDETHPQLIDIEKFTNAQKIYKVWGGKGARIYGSNGQKNKGN